MSSFEDLPGNERVCHSTIHSTAPLFNVSIVWFHSSIVWFHSSIVWFHCNFHSSMSGSSSPHHINTMFDMQNAQVAWFIITAWFRDPSSKLNLGICRDKIKIQATSMKHVVDPNGMSITLIKTAQRYRKDEVLKKLIGEDAFKSRSQQAAGNISVLAYNQCGGGEINGVGILVNSGDTKDKFQEFEEFIKRAEQGLEPSWKYLGKSHLGGDASPSAGSKREFADKSPAPSETEQPAKKIFSRVGICLGLKATQPFYFRYNTGNAWEVYQLSEQLAIFSKLVLSFRRCNSPVSFLLIHVNFLFI